VKDVTWYCHLDKTNKQRQTMGSTLPNKFGRGFWRADWFTGLVIILLVMAAKQLGWLDGLENKWYDMGVSGTSRAPSRDIEIIDIDDASVANMGRWPFSREVHAQLVDKINDVKPKVISFAVFFSEPQTDKGLVYVRKMREALGIAQGSTGSETAQLLDQAENDLNPDPRLAESMSRNGRVLLPSAYTISTTPPAGKPDAPLPEYVRRNTLDFVRDVDLFADKGIQPIGMLGEKSVGIGHLNQANDRDGSVRRELLILNHYGVGIPSLGLLTAAKALNLGVRDIQATADGNIYLGKRLIQGNEFGEMLPQFYPDKPGQRAFSRSSFYDVHTGQIPASKFAGKVVLIGTSAQGVGALFTTPGSPGTYPVDMLAHVTSSLLSEHYIVQPEWATALAIVFFALSATYIVMALPRITAVQGALTTCASALSLLALEYFLLSRMALWLPLVMSVSLLMLGYVVITTKRYFFAKPGRQKSDAKSAETNRMMGLALHAERKRQLNKALAVDERIAPHTPDDPEVQTKLKRIRNLPKMAILNNGAAHPGGALMLDDGSIDKPMLGRYQVEKELGKGAMGMVYQGRDPKTGRVVAIKTLALSREFEGTDLDDARDRFFREADTAGRLQHQNIVTIFDAGEEHDLAFIAMEFLKGRDLAEHTRPGQLLPAHQVLSIGARVAKALSYAHHQNVVHRDIKPANIMYDSASDSVKVTDFGIARVTDSSKTKTGLILGTPSFMSPEQIAGKKVDGRSDLYSLGVTLFQLLTGRLPFTADSMAGLMFKISNEQAPDLRQFMPQAPESLAEVLAMALSKRPETRHQSGDQLAKDLLDCLVDTRMGQSHPHHSGAAPEIAPEFLHTHPFDDPMHLEPPPDFEETQEQHRTFQNTPREQAPRPVFERTIEEAAQTPTSGFADTAMMLPESTAPNR
jgi:serine/threonine protein kinase/CHASE2 domain-containing sensor protein